MTTSRSTANETCKKLVEALEAIRGVPPVMIDRAAVGYYHDYLSPLTFPELELVKNLLHLAMETTTGPKSKQALLSLRQAVIDGEYDATKEESDAWAASPEGQETFRLLTQGKKPKKGKP